MDIKELLKTAIDAKIGGDQKAFAEAMKQAVATKIGSILAVESEQFHDEDGDFRVIIEEYEYNGELVDIDLGVKILHYQAPTQGNFSPRAMDPSEYSGDPEELEWDVVGASIIREDGSQIYLSPEECEHLTFNEREQEFVDGSIRDQIQAKRADSAADIGNDRY